MISQWPPRIVAFLLWMLAALSASYWLMKVIGLSETPVRADAIATATPAVNTADLLRVLGPPNQVGPSVVVSATPTPDPGVKMQLLGVVTGRKDTGIALIALEGQPARPFRVGSKISDTYKLDRVTTRSAILAAADGAASVTLELAQPTSTANAAPAQIPLPTGFPIGQSPVPNPVPPSTFPSAVPPTFPSAAPPSVAGTLPPSVPRAMPPSVAGSLPPSIPRERPPTVEDILAPHYAPSARPPPVAGTLPPAAPAEASSD